MYKELSEISETLVNSNLNEKQKSYLVFFLNKSIISAFNLNVNIQNILDVLDKYTEISYDYYTEGDNVLKRTGIVEYSVMIKELLEEI
jgi:hypothetical protein